MQSNAIAISCFLMDNVQLERRVHPYARSVGWPSVCYVPDTSFDLAQGIEDHIKNSRLCRLTSEKRIAGVLCHFPPKVAPLVSRVSYLMSLLGISPVFKMSHLTGHPDDSIASQVACQRNRSRADHPSVVLIHSFMRPTFHLSFRGLVAISSRWWLCAGRARLLAGALCERTKFRLCVKHDFWVWEIQGASPVTGR